MNVAGARVLVTGGASGLGLAFVSRLLPLGAHVWVVDRDAAALVAAEQRFGDAPRPTFLRADVGVASEAASAVEQVRREGGRLDVLVNNAAVLRDQALVSKFGKRLRRHDLGDWEETLRCNLTGPFLMAREAAAGMIEQRTGGLIVNVSSISRAGNPGQSAYAATKAALDALTVTWAQELAVHRIRVVALAPGFVETPMTAAIPPMFLESLRERTPLKRFGTLEEFGHVIQFVIENDYLNGKVLELDGGLRF